jgi:hypothetical protein
MTAREGNWAKWDSWESQLAGDESEDLSRVFTQVRPEDVDVVRAAWARDWRTRTFCNLALNLLYENTIERARDGHISCEDNLCLIARGKNLELHAAKMIRSPQVAAALSEERWRQTWRAQDAFMQDVLAYLFRPGPYVRRIREVQFRLISMMKNRPLLGPFVREAVDLEIKSNLADPLVALQTSVQAVFPAHPDVRRYLHRLDGGPLQLWARLYAIAFPAYGLTLRPGKSWFDVAYIYTTVADGVLLRTRSHDGLERLTSGEDVLSAVILGMIPEIFEVARADVEKLPLRTLPDDSINWLDPHDWEGEDR